MHAVSSVGDTPLHEAAGYGQAAFCKMLLRRGANPRACSTKGKTPLEYAQSRGYPACVSHLEAFVQKAKAQDAADRAAREAREAAQREAAEQLAEAATPSSLKKGRRTSSAPSPKSSPRAVAVT